MTIRKLFPLLFVAVAAVVLVPESVSAQIVHVRPVPFVGAG